MTAEKLPLYDLFTRLQQAGLPLGIDQYQLVLKAVQAGFGQPNRVALARLCSAVWVKSPEEQQTFDYWFEQVMNEPRAGERGSEGDSELQAKPHKLSRLGYSVALGGILLLNLGLLRSCSSIEANRAETITTTPVEAVTPTETATTAQTEGIDFEGTPEETVIEVIDSEPANPILGVLFIGALIGGFGLLAWVRQRWVRENTLLLPVQLTQQMADEIQIARLVRASKTKARGAGGAVLSGDDYSPLTRRQMKQSWRRLRRLVREGAPTELDIKATIRAIGRQGGLLAPVFVPRRRNRSELVLLIDLEGSMVPFHALSKRLTETARQGGGLHQVTVYYFHNCPTKHLYRDPARIEAISLQEVVRHLRQQTGVLIFSDAGAACGRWNPERVELTAEFLDELRQGVRYVAWLNPMPHQRWRGTTAGDIARLVPMFEFSRWGLEAAIGVLRGKSARGGR